jgi:hypothetical protein
MAGLPVYSLIRGPKLVAGRRCVARAAGRVWALPARGGQKPGTAFNQLHHGQGEVLGVRFTLRSYVIALCCRGDFFADSTDNGNARAAPEADLLGRN